MIRARAALVAIAACVAALLAAGPSTATTPGHWALVAPDSSSVWVSGVARTPDGVLHVAHARLNGTTYDLDHTPIAPSGAVGTTTVITTGWSTLFDSALVVDGGGLRALFGGTRAPTPTGVQEGLITQTAPADASTWSDPVTVYTRDLAGRPPGAAMGPGGLLTTWYTSDQTAVHAGLDPNVDAHEYRDASGGKCCNTRQNIAALPAGPALVAWCTSSDAPNGTWVQSVDPSGGAPAGPPSVMPSSTDAAGGRRCFAGRTAVTARTGGGYFVADTRGDDQQVLVWQAGSKSSRPLAKGNYAAKAVAIAPTPDGRIWVGWMEDSRRVAVHLRRSNTKGTKFGEEIELKGPPAAATSDQLEISAQVGGTLDVIGHFTDSGGSKLWHTQALPRLTLEAAPLKFSRSAAHAVKFTVLDAGAGIKGATVSAAGKHAITNAAGRATIALGPFSKKRKLAATASKKGYAGDSVVLKAG